MQGFGTEESKSRQAAFQILLLIYLVTSTLAWPIRERLSSSICDLVSLLIYCDKDFIDKEMLFVTF